MYTRSDSGISFFINHCTRYRTRPTPPLTRDFLGHCIRLPANLSSLPATGQFILSSFDSPTLSFTAPYLLRLPSICQYYNCNQDLGFGAVFYNLLIVCPGQGPVNL